MRNILTKFINAVKRFQYELFLGSCVVLIAIISYNLGQVSSLKKTPIKVEQVTANVYKAVNPESVNSNSKSQLQKLDTRVVVSKNSDKYHYSWCSGAKRIKPGNQIWFNSAEEAESRGYVLAGNCNK